MKQEMQLMAGTWWAKGITMAALTSLIPACTPGSGRAEPEPGIGPVSTITSAAQLVLPLDAYRLTKKDYIAVRRAAWLLTRDCVRRFGGEYTLSETALLADLPGFEHDNDRRYGIFDPDSAAIRGYRVPPQVAESPDGRRTGWNPSETELYLVRGSPGERATPPVDLNGRPLPEGGCAGEADRILSEGITTVPSNPNLANELSVQAHQRSEADSRVRDVVSKWSACMARSGYRYATVWEPNDYPWPSTPGPSEIATAKADVACKLEVNLVGVWYAVEAAYQERILGQNEQQLAQVQNYVQAQIRNAARVVGG